MRFKAGLAALAVAITAAVAVFSLHTRPISDYDPDSVPRPGDHITFDSTRTPHGPEHMVLGSTATTLDPYTHWKHARKTICVENRTGSQWWKTAIVGATVNWRQAGMNLFYRELGQCPSWMPESQRVIIRVYSKDDGACGKMQPWTWSNNILAKSEIWLNMHPKIGYINCRINFASRLNVLTHELGHDLGLAHNNDSSVMNTRIRPYKPSAIDLWRVTYIYRVTPL